jgi:hypothetical protein
MAHFENIDNFVKSTISTGQLSEKLQICSRWEIFIFENFQKDHLPMHSDVGQDQ